MNAVDIIVAVILIYALVKGWTGGILVQLAGIAGIIAGIWAASTCSDWLAAKLGMESTSHEVMFIVTLVVVMIAVILLLRLIDAILKSAGLSVFIRILGVIFSLGKWVLILTLLLSVYMSVVKTWKLTPSEYITESIFYKPFKSIDENVFPYIMKLGESISDDVKKI